MLENLSPKQDISHYKKSKTKFKVCEYLYKLEIYFEIFIKVIYVMDIKVCQSFFVLIIF